jgi:hypothetical protein
MAAMTTSPAVRRCGRGEPSTSAGAGDQKAKLQIFSIERSVSRLVTIASVASVYPAGPPIRSDSSSSSSFPKKPDNGGSPARLSAATKKSAASHASRFSSPPSRSSSSVPAYRSINPQQRNSVLLTTMCWTM